LLQRRHRAPAVGERLGDLIERLGYEDCFSPVEPGHAPVQLKDFEVLETTVKTVLRLANGDLVVRAKSRVHIIVEVSASENNMRYDDVRDFFDAKDYDGGWFSASGSAETDCYVFFSLVLNPDDLTIKTKDVDEIDAFFNPVFNKVD
jgi:hypothetical protein